MTCANLGQSPTFLFNVGIGLSPPLQILYPTAGLHDHVGDPSDTAGSLLPQ